MDSPVVIAIIVFLSIYLVFFLIRVLADFFLVGIALVSAVLAYNIEKYYTDILPLQEVPFFKSVLDIFNITLQKEPTASNIFTIAIFIIFFAVLASLPFLPFSATYRQMLGVEKPLATEEAKVKRWIHEELNRIEENEQTETT